ncbi:MAG: helix-turn-helix transcriptional regulator, partial [Anaerolineae bacterium]|nr:helix-turn-helix transcriptional regulator [Anaerolineae bacterium]
MNVTLVFAQNVKRIRKDLGLSQEALADKAGLHRTYVGAVERGERNITLVSANRIA